MKKNRKALSAIVGSLLLILLVLIAVGVVWGIVNNVLEDNSDTSCFGNYGKLILNPQYTCYEFNEITEQYNLRFSISVGDFDIDGIVIDLVNATGSQSFTLTKNAQTISGLKYYDGTTSVKMPDKNAGLSYNATDVGKIDSVRISPIIKDKRCEVSDIIETIENCLLFDFD